MFNGNYDFFKSYIKGKKVGVLGLGISNIPAIEFLDKLGAEVYGCDKRTETQFDAKMFDIVNKHCQKLFLGNDYLDHMDEFEIILKSPGIKLSTPQIQQAIKDGKVVTGEMEIFMSLCPCKIIGVTGSDGKTTTTTLIYEMLKKEGYRTHVGGNIGSPLLPFLDSIYEEDMVVLELSSFQLQSMHLSPCVSVITNITPNHLDYHVDMDEYIDAKSNIFKFHDENCKVVLNADNNITAAIGDKYRYNKDMFSRNSKTDGAYLDKGIICYKGKPVLDISEIKIAGMHNVENYMAAICAVYSFVSEDTIKYVARNFSGVEHRMEFVRDLDGVSFYNDSIGSSPTRTIAGIDAQPPSKIVLICGGYDKNLPFDELAKKIVDRVSGVVLVGATASKIEAAINKNDVASSIPPILMAESMDDAVRLAFSLAKGFVDNVKPVSVIMSPACASFDMYRNFEERGKHFKSIVNAL